MVRQKLLDRMVDQGLHRHAAQQGFGEDRNRNYS
jgi:hypothetical protein